MTMDPQLVSRLDCMADMEDGAERLQDKELAQAAEHMLEEMPEQRQIIFRLSRLENMRYREIATLLGISEYTVQNQMVMAMRHLSRQLDRLRELM
jgi:RNA polymerase sigma-70 factor (ECF subfamily)